MNNQKKFLAVKKLKTGDLVFEINPQSFGNLFLFSRSKFEKMIKLFLSLILIIFLPIFSVFDKLAEKRKLVVSSVGLGIGLGLSIIITQRPDVLQAFPVLDNQISVGAEAKYLKIPSIDIYSQVRRDGVDSLTKGIIEDELVHLNGSGFLGGSEPVVIADLSLKKILDNLEKIKIGDEIIIDGSNNGKYRYKVVEIRDTEAQYLQHVITKEVDSIILYKSNNLLRTQLFIVIAKSY
jgi:hypothetical protein